MASIKNPGFRNDATQRNRRISRYTDLNGDHDDTRNKQDRRHRELAADTLAFVSPDQITDTADQLGRFDLEEIVEAEGSVAQDRPYAVATVVVGQLDMVEQTITAEIAGPDIVLRSRNNKRESRGGLV
jgi:hypothetical protein